jgi:hypothetical protein
MREAEKRALRRVSSESNWWWCADSGTDCGRCTGLAAGTDHGLHAPARCCISRRPGHRPGHAAGDTSPPPKVQQSDSFATINLSLQIWYAGFHYSPFLILTLTSNAALRCQAHADAMGRWNSGAAAADGQRDWENDGRLDLRSVTSATRQLPYHLARQMNHRCPSSRPDGGTSRPWAALPIMAADGRHTQDLVPLRFHTLSSSPPQAPPAHPQPDCFHRRCAGGLQGQRERVRQTCSVLAIALGYRCTS